MSPASVGPEWSEESCRAYVAYQDKNGKHDHRPWARRIAEDFKRLRPDVASPAVLDVGGGPGFMALLLAEHFAGASLTVNDSAEAMRALANERAQAQGRAIQTSRAGAESLDDVPSGSVDLAVAKHMLRLVEDKPAALRQLHRVLKPNGVAYVVDFDPEASGLTRAFLKFWIRLTAPGFIRGEFAHTLAISPRAGDVIALMESAGLSAEVVRKHLGNYLIRAARR